MCQDSLPVTNVKFNTHALKQERKCIGPCNLAGVELLWVVTGCSLKQPHWDTSALCLPTDLFSRRFIFVSPMSRWPLAAPGILFFYPHLQQNCSFSGKTHNSIPFCTNYLGLGSQLALSRSCDLKDGNPLTVQHEPRSWARPDQSIPYTWTCGAGWFPKDNQGAIPRRDMWGMGAGQASARDPRAQARGLEMGALSFRLPTGLWEGLQN